MNNQNNTANPFSYTITFSVPASIIAPVEETFEEEVDESWGIEDYVAVAGNIMEELDKVNTKERPELIKPTNKTYLRCLDTLAVAAAWLHRESFKKLQKPPCDIK